MGELLRRSVGAIFVSSFAWALFSAAGAGAAAQTMAPGPATVPKQAVSFDAAGLDTTADPCTDFYQYACGNWRKQNPIPADKTRWGQFDLLRDRNDYLLYQELMTAAATPKTPLEKKYGDYFAACMNVDLADQLGVAPIQPELDAIAGLKDKRQLALFNVRAAHEFYGPMFLDVDVTQDQKDASKQILETYQGGLSLPDRDYYLLDDDRYKTIRQQYVAHMVTMFELLKDTPEQAATEAADVLRIETALAKGEQSRVDLRDPDKRYHILSIAAVQGLSPEFDWKQFLAGRGVGSVTTMDVASPTFVQAVNGVIAKESLAAIQHYMRWHTLNPVAALLSKPYAEENFAFFQKTLNGQEAQTPRWKRCSRLTDTALGEAVGQDWVKQNFPPSSKESMNHLIDALDKALAEDIQQLPWMSEPTKKEAEAKLKAMQRKIGYPDHWRDYSKLAVKRNDPVGDVEAASRFEDQRNLNKLGKPVDKSEWDMTPPTVNAYYDGSQVNINFPAGILQPPFFDPKADAAVNFGAIGVVIGHEMTHGFDDQGAKFDLLGNQRNWFTPEDLKQFQERTKCVADEYSGFEVAPGQNLNGRLTLGENTADNGGLRIAFRALQETLAAEGAAAEPGYVDGKRDGYTAEQRYFIGFAQVWCENIREASARVLAKTDPHSSGRWRVNGTVQNFDEFGKAFSCKVGQPMMPANGCRVW
jgi:putative endopeptidase